MTIKFLLKSTAIVCSLLLCGQCSKGKADIEVTSAVSYVEAVSDWNYGQQAYDHAAQIVSFGPRPAESQELEKARQYIQAELKKRGWLVKRQAFTAVTPQGEKQFVNLYARFQGVGKSPDQVWKARHHAVIGAHIDTKKIPGIDYLGAVDAAGSVGALIEMADFLAKYQPQHAELLELVFFDGEEAIEKRIQYQGGATRDGLYGSHYYASKRNGERKFGIVLDLIGHKDQVIRVPSDSPLMLAKSMKHVAKQQGVLDQFQVADESFVDDHIPLNIFGTPTIDLIGEFDYSGNSTWWHQKGDTMDQLSAKQLGITIKVALDMIATEFAK